MKAVLGFIWGVFAHHIGTKTLSLLLAILLFVFVQQSGQGVRDIAEITLRFSLSEDLRADFVLLDDAVRLTEVRIQGKRSTVDEVAREYSLNNTREVTITRAFLGTHATGRRIPITSRLLRDIESQEIDVISGLDGQAIRFDDKIAREMDVVLAPDQEDKRRLGNDSSYLPLQGDLVDVRFSIERIRIEGPRSAFDLNAEAQKEQTLLVVIPDLNRALRSYQTEEDEPEVVLPVVSDAPTPEGHIDWVSSGFDMALLGYLVIVEPQVMTDKIFEKALRMRFRVRAQVEKTQLDIGIVVRRPVKGGVDLAEWELLSSLVNAQDMLRERVSNLPLRMPGALKARLNELRDELVLVLDLTRGEFAGTELKVPIYLDLRDRSKAKLEDLRRISIDGPSDVTFQKK